MRTFEDRQLLSFESSAHEVSLISAGGTTGGYRSAGGALRRDRNRASVAEFRVTTDASGATGTDGVEITFVDRKIRTTEAAVLGSTKSRSATRRAPNNCGLVRASFLDLDELSARTVKTRTRRLPGSVELSVAYHARNEVAQIGIILHAGVRF